MWLRYQRVAYTSAKMRIGSAVPGMSRPVTAIASRGVASRPAPGNAVFERPVTSAASAPMTRVLTVNTLSQRVVR